jgi:hypothetical protein
MGPDADDLALPPPTGQLLISQEGGTRLQVRLDGQTVWLTQAAMAELFQTTSQNITIHLQGIYADAELLERATCKEYLQVRREGNRDVKRSLKHYNLDAILAVGYRVRSARGTAFRQWATAQLRELLVCTVVITGLRPHGLPDDLEFAGATLISLWNDGPNAPPQSG